MVNLHTLDVTDEDSVVNLVYNADLCMQYGENNETKESSYQNSEQYISNNNGASY